MTQNIKRKVRQFIKKHDLRQITYAGLKQVAEDMGYTVIEFNSSYNESNIQTVINNLNLQDAIIQSRGFTYIDKKYRLIFVNESLNEEEKQLVMSHELGHILCGHFNTCSIIGKDVRDEFEANEFSHYLLKRNIGQKISCFVRTYKKATIVITVMTFLTVTSLGVAAIVKKSRSYYGEYYITEVGNKYHKKDCIFIKNKRHVKRLSKEKFNSGQYAPCKMCLPGD